MRGAIISWLIAFGVVFGSPSVAQDSQIPLDYLEDFAGVLPDGSFAFALQVSDNLPPELENDVFEPGWVIVELHQTEPDILITEGPQHILEVLGRLEPGAVVYLTMVGLESGNTRERRVEIRSEVELLAGRQFAAARDSQIFSAASNQMALRLQLFLDGSFEALAELARDDMRARVGTGYRPEWVVSRIGVYTPSNPPRYTPMIANYAAMRLAVLGSCGHPVTPMRLDVNNVSELRTLSGYTIRRDDLSFELDFEALSRFVPVIRANAHLPQEGMRGWSRIRDDFRGVFANLSCSSPLLRQLEANMIAYASGQPPRHVRGIVAEVSP
jgi:hypothetical protein